MNFVKFIRTPFLQNTSGRLVLLFIVATTSLNFRELWRDYWEICSQPLPMFWYCASAKGVIRRTRNTFAEIAVVAERYFIITHHRINSYKKQAIKDAAVPSTPSRKIGWWKNANEIRKNLFAPHLQYCHFEEDAWINRNFLWKVSWI